MPLGGVENAAPAACPACPEPAAGQDRSQWTHVDRCYSAEAPWPGPAATQDGELVLSYGYHPSWWSCSQEVLSPSLLIGTLQHIPGSKFAPGALLRMSIFTRHPGFSGHNCPACRIQHCGSLLLMQVQPRLPASRRRSPVGRIARTPSHMQQGGRRPGVGGWLQPAPRVYLVINALFIVGECMSACGPAMIMLGSCLVWGGRNGLGCARGSCLCWPHQPACMPKCFIDALVLDWVQDPCSCMHETVHEDVVGEGAVHRSALRCERWGG